MFMCLYTKFHGSDEVTGTTADLCIWIKYEYMNFTKSRRTANIVIITSHMSNRAWFDEPIVRSYTVLFRRGRFNFKANALFGWIAKFQISCNNFCEWTYTKQLHS